jgi:hypothetical protein
MTLDLSNKGLKILPDIPEWIDGNPITRLPLFNNKLIELPENLPNTIEVLDVQQNNLTHLPKKLPNKLHRPKRKMRQNAVMTYIFYNYVSSNLLNVLF